MEILSSSLIFRFVRAYRFLLENLKALNAMATFETVETLVRPKKREAQRSRFWRQTLKADGAPIQPVILLRVFDLSSWAILLVQAYRILLSPILGGNCRFHPSCSAYAQECLRTMPFFCAVKWISKRLLSCRPGGRFGFDPPPGQDKCNHSTQRTWTK